MLEGKYMKINYARDKETSGKKKHEKQVMKRERKMKNRLHWREKNMKNTCTISERLKTG